MDDPSVLASLAAIAAAAACFATPASYLHARTIAQRHPLRAVHSGVPTVLFVQRWECRALTLLFDVTAFSVSVPFYALALPLLAWTGHLLLCRKLTVLMTLVMWLGNATKDALCLPRPRALSKAVRVITPTEDSRENSEEYGLPSTHVANCLTFFAFALAHAPEAVRASPAAWAALAAWTLLVALGRLYLGMHTPVDLAAGACVGAAALAVWAPLHAPWDAWLLSAGVWRVAAVHAAGCALMACCYPRPPALTPSFSFVTFFSGVTAGVAVGTARAAGLAASALPAAPAAAAATLAARAAVVLPLMLLARASFRAAAGLAWPAVAAALDVAAAGAARLLPPLPRPKSPRCVEAPPPSALFDARYLFLRFWGYAALGWTLTDPGMLALRACGLL